ncbi:DNA-binding protein WhiA [Spiroplasma taiwanense]|uniref:Probable cell division protein WhiA n=1 Tax=Spiroplasma taiwanense CT-1 TaxID=1276220 RepID=S5MFX8_9MOLU|nr:DNA-binding protein WhiA [Spiroplasma taiwanense]AGR40770.1 hypothetical protein STAIW_v1c00780 [Spiroplasma taiwanense CT-1]
MSFSLEVKEEILNHTFTDKQKNMLISGFIKYNGDLIFGNDGAALRLTSNSNNIIRNIYSILKYVYKKNINISIIQTQNLSKKKIYQLLLIEDIMAFLKNYLIYDDEKLEKIVEIPLFQKNLKEKQSLIRAYVSGIFIAIGSVNSPDTTNYHLELQFKDEFSAIYFCEITNLFNFNFKIFRKKNTYMCYIKKSIEISDFLKFIDASRAVLKFETTRINRDFNNNINRMMNIDIYNQQKTLFAGAKQIEQINIIIQKGLFNELSEKAQLLATIRLENPDSSFSELEIILNDRNVKITKSGISNLFKIISRLAESIGV